MKTEREKALANIPNGYEVVNEGDVQKGDLAWSSLGSFNEPLVPSHRKGVENYYCVIRPIKSSAQSSRR